MAYITKENYRRVHNTLEKMVSGDAESQSDIDYMCNIQDGAHVTSEKTNERLSAAGLMDKNGKLLEHVKPVLSLVKHDPEKGYYIDPLESMDKSGDFTSKWLDPYVSGAKHIGGFSIR